MRAAPAGDSDRRPRAELGRRHPFRDTGILLLNAGLVAIGGGAAVLTLAGSGPLHGRSVRLGLGMLAVGLVSLAMSGIMPIPDGSNNLTSRPYLITAGVGVLGLLVGVPVTGLALVRSTGPSRIAGAVVVAGLLLVVLYPTPLTAAHWRHWEVAGMALLSQRYRCAYTARVAQLRLARRLHDSFRGVPFASSSSADRLPVTIIRHESLLRRRLGTSDPALQDGKVANLALAIPSVDGLLILPGETFSFWNRVGPPSARRGYQTGLVLRGGRPAAGTGGGLCQLANLLHWMVLHTPLEIVERHHHSVDPFPDDRRALPFGTGAGVFYNYVDLRFRNDTAQPFQLEVWLTGKQLCGRIRTDRELGVAYHVFETDHHFEACPAGVVRCNEVWRRHVDSRTGQPLREERLMRNRSLVAYPVDPAVVALPDAGAEQGPP